MDIDLENTGYLTEEDKILINRNKQKVNSIVEMLRGDTYSFAIDILRKVKQEIENNMILN